MKYLILFLLIPGLSFSQGLDSTMTASPAEQLMFSLNFRTMNYWHAEAMVQRKELAIQDTIIQLYSEQTGVYKANIKTMKDNFALKTSICETCVPKLSECEVSLLKFQTRCKRRGWTIAIGVPVSIGLGFIGGIIYNSVK